MARIAIIADDLTGASDTGVQFARKGLPTRVLFDAAALDKVPAGAEAVAIDTDSRAIAPSEARERSRMAAEYVRRAGIEHVFKKADSTLRGNLGPEIDGILAELDVDVAVAALAFPRLGRTTVGGRHYLRGLPLEETEIANDPKAPVRQSLIGKLIESQAPRKTGGIGLEVLRSGPSAVLAALAALRAAGAEVIIFDAAEEEDLERMARAVAGSGLRVLWVGSAGLADYLPAVLGLGAPRGGSEAAPANTGVGGPVMLVAGSVSPTTRAQVGSVQQEPGVAAVELNPRAIFGEADGELERCELLLAAALSESRDVALVSGTLPEQVTGSREAGARLGLDATAVSDRIAAALGEVTARLVGRFAMRGLVLTGGDTAKAVCRRLGVSGLEVLHELEPGVPLSRMTGGGNLLVVTKAGAFGTAETLVRALKMLKGEQ